MSDDEKAANEYVKARKEYDYIKIILGDIKPAFLDGIEHGRKGYIKEEKAIEVVAMNLCRQVNGLLRWEQIKDSEDSLDKEDLEGYLALAKKELGIE